jgi:hypothetical protein
MKLKAPMSDANPECLLDRIDSVMSRMPAKEMGQPFADKLFAGFVPAGGEMLPHHKAALTLGLMLQKRKLREEQAAEEKKKAGKKDGKKSESSSDAKPAPKAVAAAARDTSPGGSRPPTKEAAAEAMAAKMLGGIEAVSGEKKEGLPDPVAAALWASITKRTDEIFVVAEAMRATFADAIKRMVFDLAVAAGVEEAVRDKMITDITFFPMMDPVRLHQRGVEDFDHRFSDGELAEACVPDVLRARVTLPTGQLVFQLIDRLIRGVAFPEVPHQMIEHHHPWPHLLAPMPHPAPTPDDRTPPPLAPPPRSHAAPCSQTR